MRMKNQNGSRLLRILSIFVLLSLCSACFITNCPPGGKRSILPAGRSRQCMTCGPGGEGRCLGPDICCGPFGCLMKTAESLVCRLEILNPHVCRVPGRSCGAVGSVCTSTGLCCSSESCSVDKTCQNPRSSTQSEELSELDIPRIDGMAF